MNEWSEKWGANPQKHVTRKPRMGSFNQAEWDIGSICGFTVGQMGRPWKLPLTFNSIPLADVLKIEVAKGNG